MGVEGWLEDGRIGRWEDGGWRTDGWLEDGGMVGG